MNTDKIDKLIENERSMLDDVYEYLKKIEIENNRKYLHKSRGCQEETTYSRSASYLCPNRGNLLKNLYDSLNNISEPLCDFGESYVKNTPFLNAINEVYYS